MPPPREAHIPVPPAAWDQLREQTGLGPEAAQVEGPGAGGSDYFDRLDAAFDSLDAQLAGRAAKGPRPAAAAAPIAPPPPPPAPSPAVEQPAVQFDNDWLASAIAPEPPARVPPNGAAAPVAPMAPNFLTTMSASPVADAFESLLAAEQGEVLPPQAPTIEITDEVIERIAIRVAERLTQSLLMDKVTDIVSAATERLVKEEIARIRAAAEARKR